MDKPFLEDKQPPNAILMEYIPNLHQIDVSNYTKDRDVALLEILRKIHSVHVCQGDPYSRKMMVQEETGRVVWIDFDRAQTFPYGPVMLRHYDWLVMDIGMTEQLMEELEEDMKEGKPVKAWDFYYHYS